MGFGRYRFRRSFGNVSSQFRGARFDTYPLNPYPLAGRVLDLSNFDYSLSEVPDISGEGNNAVLYSARGINLAGSGYAELPNVGATKSITVLARSSTDTTLYATDDATQTEDASVTLVANDTWQEVTLTFTSAISGAIRLGTNGTNFFSGDLADAVCKDASGSTLDQFYLNEHTDTAVNGLDGLSLVGRNGSVGQYVDAAAVVQIPGDVGGLTPPQVLGMNFNQYRQFNGSERVTGVLAFSSATDAYVQLNVAPVDFTPASNQRLFSHGSDVSGNNFNATLQTTGNIIFSVGGNTSGLQSLSVAFQGAGLYRLELNGGTQLRVLFNGVEIDSATIPATTLLTSSRGFALGSQKTTATAYFTGLISSVNLNGQIAYDGYGPTPWADTIGSNDGTESGTFENVLVPASISNSSLDAFGNAMDLRESKEFNFDGSGYAVAPDDGSLDLTGDIAIVMRGDFYESFGTFETFISKWDTNNERSFIVDKLDSYLDGEFRFAVSSDGVATDSVKFSGVSAGDCTLIVNKSGSSVEAFCDETSLGSFTISSAIYSGSADLLIGGVLVAGAPSSFSRRPISDIKIYNRALTAEEVATFL